MRTDKTSTACNKNLSIFNQEKTPLCIVIISNLMKQTRQKPVSLTEANVTFLPETRQTTPQASRLLILETDKLFCELESC